MGKIAKYTRRGFLGLGIAAAGGLAVGYYYYKKPYPNPLPDTLAEGDFSFTPYVIIGSDNAITIITPRAEMGQGIHTTLAALVAEELDVDMDQISAEHGPAAAAYYNSAMLREGAPFAFFDEGFVAEIARGALGVAGKFLALQVTGGSSASIDAFDKMREAGATARAVLVEVAAQRWGVSAESLTTARAEVVNPNGERLTYGALAADAATLTLPKPPALKDPSEWRILGKSQPRVEMREKITGAPIYGIDVQLPNMLYATVAMSPRFGAKAKHADEAAAMAVAGVLNVVEIATNTGHGFGIIASNTWAAFEGARALAPEWEAASYPEDTAGLKVLWAEALDRESSFTLGGEGDPEAAMQGAEVIEARYSLPYLAHTTMEPMNATAQFVDGKLTLWLGSQAPGLAAMVTADLLGIETDDVEVITTSLGGGFGRRVEADVPLYAAAIAAQTGGKPVKVTWSREEDIQHDTYRPMAEARLKAILKNGLPEALDYRVAAPSINKSLFGRTFPNLSAAGPDRSILDGSFDQPFSWPHSRFAAHQVDTDIPVGFWRSVGNSINGFVHESFLDELAFAGGKDPLEMRLAMMQDERHAPAREALKAVAEMAGWGQALPEGVGQGIAHTLSFGTWVAEVVQVDMRGGTVKLEKIWAAADPGMILDPGNFEAQITSGIIYGLSAAIGQEISFADGRVVQENFYDYDALRMAGVPPIEVALLENSPRMGGAGEPGTPPIAAALGNAIFAASGKRQRSLPFGNEIDFDID
ncbi:MAG: xanthine dehydrogenase family protein molybdopterin-binding subunit [Rhodobacteraceae bacterium]|nr:xanthine dehydrogenase family protein molybdopterin-binding subunit [Paracoccaceae bacterium]